MDNETPTKEEIIDTTVEEVKEEVKEEPVEEVKPFDPITRVYYKDFSDSTRKNGENRAMEVELNGKPEVIKYYTADGVAHQYLDAKEMYNDIEHKIKSIVKILVTNNNMRSAVEDMIKETLSDSLLKDAANEGDEII